MTPEQWDELLKRTALAEAPSPTPAPPEPEPEAPEAEAAPPAPKPPPKPAAKKPSSYADLLQRYTQKPVVEPVQDVVAPTSMLIGDVLDLDPAQAPSPTTAAVLRTLQAGATGSRASPFRYEPGGQMAEDVRLVPLQRASGEYGIPPSVMEKSLAELRFMQYAKRNGMPPINQMSPEQYAEVRKASEEEARRDTARILGTSEHRQNLTMPVDPDKVVEDIMSGASLPWYLYPTPVGATTLGYRARQAMGMEIPWLDEASMSMIRPWLAEAQPGLAASDLEGGQRVQGYAKEHPLWWALRTSSVSTPFYSWFLDPKATWSLGGETGFGGERQVRRIAVEQYDPIQDIPVLGRYIDPLGESTGVYPHATAIIMGTLMLEPDVFSVATLGLGKAYEAFSLSKRVLENGAKYTDDAAKVLREGGSVLDAQRMAKTDADRALLTAAMHATQAELREVAPAAARLNPATFHNAERLADEAGEAATEAAAGAEKAKTVLDSARVARDAATQEAAAAVKAYREAQDALVSSRALTGQLDELRAGDMVVDTASGQSRRFVRYTSQGGKQLVVVADEAGKEIGIPFSRAMRVANPGVAQDVVTVMRDLDAAKRGYNKTIAALKAAREAGDPVQVKEMAKQARLLRQKIVRVTSQITSNVAEAEFMAARKAVQDKILAMDRLRGSKFGVPQAEKMLADALSAAEARRVEAEALAKVRQKLIDNLEKSSRELRAAQKASMEPSRMGRSVLDAVVQRSGKDFALDMDAYRAALIEKYGAEAVDRYLKSPSGAPLRSTLDGPGGTLNIRGVEALRDLETGLHHTAESSRLGKYGVAQSFLTTVQDQRFAFPSSLEGLTVLAYQQASWLSRNANWISASAIGRAAEPIREAARRGVERLGRIEHELGAIAKLAGAEGVYDFLTSHKVFEGAISNQAPLTHLERAVLYLRMVANGDAWEEDVVVKALSSFPQATGMATPQAAGTIRNQLRELALKDDFSPAALWKFVEQTAPTLQRKVAGVADTDEKMLRFVSRAIAAASNQYDTVQELGRVVGTQLTRNDIDALNWFARGEVGALAKAGPEAAERAYEVARLYGLPFMHEMRSNVRHLFSAGETQVRILKFGEQAGNGVYLPKNIIETLNDIPVNLAKEIKEFHESSMVAKLFDKVSRNWRMVAVNGWLLPRPAIFLTNFLGDWAQMTTSVGIVEATRISAQALPGYLPFVGPRLEKAFGAVRTRSIMPALLDRNLNTLLRGSEDAIIETSEGVMSHRRFLQEAYEDGVWGNINSRDLQEALGGATRTWWQKMVRMEPTPLIEASARMLEEAQSRARLLLYMDARTGRIGQPMLRKQARDVLVDALYDWKTGVPAWEHKIIGRLFAFWTFRRGMMTQAMNAVMEGMAEPSLQMFGKAMTGRTKLARMRQMGRAVTELPDISNGWQDPEQVLDDYEQLEAFGRGTAPWWADAQTFLGGIPMSKERQLWHSEVSGRKVTYDAVMLPTLTTMDQLVILNTLMQTMMASSVMAAEAAGLNPKMTTADAERLAEVNIDAFTDMLIPYADEAVKSMLYNMAGMEVRGGGDRGIAVPRAQAILLRRILDASGQSHFMAAHEDDRGQLRMDRTMYGHLTNLLLLVPQASDVARTWAVFDNPSMQQSLELGLAEALGQWSGLVRLNAHDPMQSRTYEVQAQEREFKDLRSTLEKEAGRSR